MEKNTILFVIVAALAGFIGGFMLANTLNSREMTAQRSTGQPQTMAANSNSGQPTDEPTLSPAEIKAKIDEADSNPDNFAFQKNLGIGLYRYGAMKQDVEILGESARILTRASTLDAKDFDVLVALGNAHFDIGFAKKEVAGFAKAREVYVKALALKPTDADVRTDIGISYYVQEPADLTKAAAELEAVSKANPRHDRSMQFLAQVYLQQNKIAQAETLVAKIKELNPSSQSLKELTSQINIAKGTAK